MLFVNRGDLNTIRQVGFQSLQPLGYARANLNNISIRQSRHTKRKGGRTVLPDDLAGLLGLVAGHAGDVIDRNLPNLSRNAKSKFLDPFGTDISRRNGQPDPRRAFGYFAVRKHLIFVGQNA